MVVVPVPVVPLPEPVPVFELPVPEVSAPVTEVLPGAVLAGPEGVGVELGFTEPEPEPHADNTMSALIGKRNLARINPGTPCKELSQHDRNDIAKIEFARAIVSQSAKMRCRLNAAHPFAYELQSTRRSDGDTPPRTVATARRTKAAVLIAGASTAR